MNDWRDRADCRPENDIDPHLFDLDIDGESETDRAERHHLAATICARCPVRAECLAEGLTDPRTEGVRAGYVLETERNAI